MKVIGFNQLGKNKKKRKVRIYCIGNVFKPLFLTMSAILFLLVTNLVVHNFFANIHASVEHFVQSFIKFFRFI